MPRDNLMLDFGNMPPIILSAGNGTGGIVFIVLVLIFWAVSAIANLSKKQKERERRLLEQLRAGVPVPQAPAQKQNPFDPNKLRQMAGAARPKMSPAPKMPRIGASRIPAKIKAPPPRRRTIPTAPPMARPQAAILLEEAPGIRSAARPESRAQQASVATVTRPAPTTPSASAPMLKRWLRPNTLRAQFILTEVFQPPLALREERSLII